MLMLGALCFERQTAFRDAYLRRLCDGQEIRLAGKLYKVEEKTHCFYYYLTDCSVELSDQTMPCNDVLAYVSSDDDSVGQILILQGTISLFDEATNEGQFDARSFYRSQKIDFGLWGVHIALAIHHLVPVPVDYRAACYAYLEHIRVVVMKPPNDHPCTPMRFWSTYVISL